MAKNSITWPNGYGAKETFEELGSAVPAVYLIGGDGRILWTDNHSRYRHNLSRFAEELQAAIKAALLQRITPLRETLRAQSP